MRFRSATSLFLGLVALLEGTLRGATPAAEAHPFTMERWDRQGTVSLSDFAGKIVVLDFFAYWCVPCAKASAEIESKIHAHYAARNGNPAGIPVEVLAVNVEAEQRPRTEAFIKKHKLGRVVDDKEGEMLRKYGGTSLPHLVVIDGTAGPTGEPEFRVVYRKGGFEGADKIRAVIDAIGAARPRASLDGPVVEFEDGNGFRPDIGAVLDRMIRTGRLPLWASVDGTVADSRVAESDEGESDSFGIPQRATLAFDGAFSSDVQLTQESASYRLGEGVWEVLVTGGLGTIGLDYAPVSFDFLGEPTRVDEVRGYGQIATRWRALDVLTVLGGAGLYDGFTDFRSAWLSEYYRQQFSALPGYVGPTPSGHNLTAGLRWEYLPGSGFAQLDFSYLNDEIAPGYEIDFDGLRRGRSFLYTTVVRVSFENVLHRRLRVLHEFRRIDTSDRDLRLGYQGSANLALGERWVVRLQGGLAAEDPQFDAWYGGATVEYEASTRWRISASGRYYEDTGEIENSNFSNAAPPLRAWQAGVGVRYVGEGWAFKLFAAPYSTRYGSFGIGTAFFGNLYRGRDWGLVQAAVDHEF
ncbi:MAG: TlpA family protein disulfide reductase [Limisphaerales bacterium]